ncbi:S41 family peptidase [Brevundimonas sp.]|uniref:S41 family peptidase n=1 Tax=Brevundimonas sp. TaxID=1871086 RepID=UPI003F6EAFAA
MTTRLLAAASALALFSGLSALPAVAQDAPTTPSFMTEPRDWSATLREDVTALHAVIMDSHPGPYDSLNPEFRTKAEAGLALALQRAETTTDAGGWWWALRAYVASFDDGHVQMYLKDQSGGFPTRWPGFLTAYRGADQIVLTRDETDASTPPIGAKLIDCDGVPADRLAAERIGAFRGRWFLEAQHASLGDWEFMSASNPWVPEMRACRFEVAGRTRSWTLNWRPIAAGDISTRRQAVTGRGDYKFGLATLDDGAVWFSAPSFDGNPGGAAHTALTPLMEEMKTRQAELRAAPYVVLDLRGNGGGSSHWSQLVAQALWGDDWMETHSLPSIEAIEWRASDGNLAAVQSYFDRWTAAGESAERIGWAREIVDGMTTARAEGKPYWRDAPPPADPTAPPPVRPEAPQLVRGPVYVLTDAGCGSACLDAVDLWKAAGAIQIGRETSADTVYMDVRGDELPSGLVQVGIPMKVWRGRQRGNNEPQRPAHEFDGDMTNTAAVQAWIRTLPET